MKDLMNHRAVRLLVSVVLTFLFMGILVVCTSDKDPNRILVMLGGTMPEGLIQGFTYFLFFFGMCEVAWISGRITHENDAFSAHLLPEKENWVLSADDVSQLKLNMQSMERSQKFYMTDLIKKACTKYRLSKSSSEVLDLVDAQVRIYQEEMESEQSFISYVAWAIPSVGFIGTVICRSCFHSRGNNKGNGYAVRRFRYDLGSFGLEHYTDVRNTQSPEKTGQFICPYQCLSHRESNQPVL